jgi:fructose-1,6-bisphosphatase/inositol monophosphatase family enzyme
MAAGWLIAQEAGCVCGHIQNTEQEFNAFLTSDVLVAGTSALYDGLQSILQKADSK